MGIENPVHLIFLAAVALVVLGPKRLPELARAAGKGMREFRESLNGEASQEEPAGAAVVQPATAAPPQPPPQQQPQPQAQLLSGAPAEAQPTVPPPDSPV
jgi:TatA/E family protein of Tat protein translocase